MTIPKKLESFAADYRLAWQAAIRDGGLRMPYGESTSVHRMRQMLNGYRVRMREAADQLSPEDTVTLATMEEFELTIERTEAEGACIVFRRRFVPPVLEAIKAADLRATMQRLQQAMQAGHLEPTKPKTAPELTERARQYLGLSAVENK